MPKQQCSISVPNPYDLTKQYKKAPAAAGFDAKGVKKSPAGLYQKPAGDMVLEAGLNGF